MVNITPTELELFPKYNIKCKETNCNSIFTNKGNYNLHLLKHHGISFKQTDLTHIYFCPVDDCIYNINNNNGRNFKVLKYLRQHYQKVHLPKSNLCEQCGKKFFTYNELQQHILINCGKKFKCSECGWNNNSKQALLTHLKRKHKQERNTDKEQKKEDFISKSKQIPLICHQETQTELCCKNTSTATTQTESTIEINSSITPQVLAVDSTAIIAQHLDDIQSFLRDTETQTDFHVNSFQGQQNNSFYFNQILPQSIDIYTQTGDIASNFENSDIETQTYKNNKNGLNNQESTQMTNFIQMPSFSHQKTQTKDAYVQNNFCTAGTQTLKMNGPAIPLLPLTERNSLHQQQLEDIQLFLRDTETQTEFQLNSFKNHVNNMDDSLVLHQMFGQPIDMYTQTSENILPDFGFTDIQTQTNWSTLSAEPFEDMFVSTETQTSFSECFFNSCKEVVSNESDFTNECTTTQCTQTCDNLLESIFGTQENDLLNIQPGTT